MIDVVTELADDLPQDRSLVVRSDPQLRRIVRTIEEIEARPPAAQRAMQTLLAALRSELETIHTYRSQAVVSAAHRGEASRFDYFSRKSA